MIYRAQVVSISISDFNTSFSIHSPGGIGLATVKQFLKANIEGLLLIDISHNALSDAIATLAPEEQVHCEIYVADVSVESECRYAEKAVQRWGRLDIAVLNAGICLPPASILDTDVSTWDKLMNVNARGGKN